MQTKKDAIKNDQMVKFKFVPRMDDPRSLYPLNDIECEWSLVTMTKVSSILINFKVASIASDNRTVSNKAWAACPLWWAKSMRPPST